MHSRQRLNIRIGKTMDAAIDADDDVDDGYDSSSSSSMSSSSQQQQPTQPPRIWFRLVDPRGQPCSGDVTSVLRHALSAPLVVQFKDAVKAKYADSKLLNMDAVQMLVYASRGELKAGRPLAADAVILDDYGATAREPLLVVRPSTPRINIGTI